MRGIQTCSLSNDFIFKKEWNLIAKLRKNFMLKGVKRNYYEISRFLISIVFQVHLWTKVFLPTYDIICKKLRYSFYKANTAKNSANVGKEMTQFSMLPCSHCFIRNWNCYLIHGTFKKHLHLPIHFAESIYFLLKRSKKLQ